MAKKITILVECDVESNTTEESVAEQIQSSLKHLAARIISAGTVKVIGVERETVNPNVPSAGYDSRMWEKTTC